MMNRSIECPSSSCTQARNMSRTGWRGLGLAVAALLLSVLLSGALARPALAELDFMSAGFHLTGPAGTPSRQAGAHPDVITEVRLNEHFDADEGKLLPDGSIKDVSVELPPGLVGNPTAAPTCSVEQFRAAINGVDCPIASQIGFAKINVLEPGAGFDGEGPFGGIYNLQHGADVPALFAFDYGNATIFITPRVRPGDYGISADSLESSQADSIYAFKITLWGVPADPSHDSERIGGTRYIGRGVASPDKRKPFLSAPTSCGASPFTIGFTANSWEEPERYVQVSSTADLDGSPFLNEGCDKLQFGPTIVMRTSSHAAGAPTGLAVDLKLPQSEDPDGLATADLRKAVVTLPPGMSVSASSAAGLGACSTAQIGIGSNDAPTCPDSSKLGTVEIDTPLLTEPIKGDVILAKQGDNPFGSLLALYLAVKGPGFYLKLPGRVDLDPATGQLTATFDNTPQLPFTEMHLVFTGGPRAALANGPACGTFSAHAELSSWASETPVVSDMPLAVNEDCGSGAFAPGFSAGTESPLAGSTSSFHLHVTDDQVGSPIARIDTTLPSGLLALIGSVPLCPEAQAAAGTCSAASQIGTTTVGAGAGDSPVFLPEADKAPTAVYLAGPYEGAPFSLSIVVPAQAGPFDLGSVVVRAGLFVDPKTAQATVKSDPLPTILQGIPLDVRDLRVDVTRPRFMFNPTSCAVQTVTGSIVPAVGQTGAPSVNAAGVGYPTQTGAAAAVSSRFQVGSCATLAFKPKLSASTQSNGKFNGNGASLDVKLAAPGEGPRSDGTAGESDIAKVDVELPKLLPSRLTTLQKACTAAQFATNPAGCPAASNVGSATASTPVLAHPLSGPAYLVSHGGAAFPDLVVVLQGEGVRIDLTGNTFISKAGVTSSKFETVPDAPISSFELNLPEGPHSALGTGLRNPTATLCAQSLVMPTTLTGQNGTVVRQSTNIAVTGCAAAILVASHKVKGHTATVVVAVPGAGKLVAGGSGLSEVSNTAAAAKNVTLKLALSRKAQAIVKSKGKLRVKVKVTFTPKKGHKLTKSVTVSFT
jgi:hypothetical protein